MKHTKIYHITARFLLAAILLAVSWTSAKAQNTVATDFKGSDNNNPISANIFCAEPTALEYNGRLYVYGSNDHQEFVANDKQGENTYGSIKSIVIFSTDDMVNWTFHGTIDTKKLCASWVTDPWWQGYGASWAPSVTWRHNEETGRDEFFLYFCNSSHGVGVLTAESPIGPWKSPNNQMMIHYDTPGANPIGTNANFDPGVVIDDNGVGWITFGGLGSSEIMPDAARIIKLKPSMTEVDSAAVKIPAPYHFEANELNFIGGKYVYTYSSNWITRDATEWGTYKSEHNITADAPSVGTMCYMVSDNPLNPDSWVFKGMYGPHPGNGSDNNHSHLQKFQGDYYYIYHNAALKGKMQELGAVDTSTGTYRSLCVNKATVDESTTTISLVTLNTTGATQIKNVNPYELHQAETMASCGGIEYEDFTNIKNNTRISALGNDASENMQVNMKEGSWINLRKVDFGTNGAEKFILRAKGTGTIDIRTGGTNPRNTRATIEFSSTEMEEQTFDIDASKFNGVTTNLFVIVTAAEDFYVDAWQFVQSNAAEITEPYAVLDGTTLYFYYDDQKDVRGGMSIQPFTVTFNDDWTHTITGRPWEDSVSSITTVVFDPSFANCTTLISTAGWFSDHTNLTTIRGLEYLKTDNVTDMMGMFWECSGLTSLDLSSFNTQNVTRFSHMFSGCSQLKSINLSSFNTSKAQYIDNMFFGCSSLTTLDLSSFNTSSVLNMDQIFVRCSSLTTIYAGSGWTTENVTSTGGIRGAFEDCSRIVGGAGTTYDASHIDVSYARIDGGPNSQTPGYLTELIRKTLTPDDYFEWNGMGAGATKKSETPSRLCNYYIGQSAEVPYGDPNVSAYAYADLSAYDRLEITATAGTPRILLNRDAEDGYWNADESQSHQIESTQSGWSSKYFSHSGNVWTVDLKQMVADKGFAHLNAIKGDNWSAVTVIKIELVKINSTVTAGTGNPEPYAVLNDNGSVVTDGEGTTLSGKTLTFYYDDQKAVRGGMEVKPFQIGTSFANCTTLTSTDYWFYSFSNLTTVRNIENLKTPNVTTMECMFGYCSSLTSLDLSSLNTDNVTSLYGMFLECTSLKTLDLSGFNTSKVTNMNQLFYPCSSLKTIYVGSGWSTEAVTEGNYIFNGCTSLVGGAGTRYDSNHVDKTYARIDGGTSAPGYFTVKTTTTTPEPYAVLSNNNTVLTFYYDDQKSARGHDVRESIVYAVIDPSMSQYTSLVSTGWWFYGCKNLKSVSGWENLYPLNIVDMWGTFEDCSSLPSDPAAGGPDFSNFYSNSLKRTVAMFHGCTSMTSLDLSALNTSNVTENEGMFEGCTALTTIYVGSGWDMSNATDNWVDNMFSGCTSLVGGAGTRYDANNIGTSYAHIDGGIDNPGYLTELIRKPLTAADYFEWTGMKANATKKSESPYPNCYYILGQSAEIPYGEPDVNPYTYADVSMYDRLEVTATGNTPRILLNRDSVGGQWNEDESLSHMIESTQRGWSSKYFSHSGNVWTVDLKQIQGLCSPERYQGRQLVGSDRHQDRVGEDQ